jgi:hypothetical protein
VCTPSNKAVDEIVSRVAKKGLIGRELGNIVRVGSLEYLGDPAIRHLGLDQIVNVSLNQRYFDNLA